MSVKRSWLLLAGHPFFLVILCQCKLKKCEHGGGWERTDKKIITQCKDKKCGDEKDKIYSKVMDNHLFYDEMGLKKDTEANPKMPNWK